MIPIRIGTRNAGKLREFREMLGPVGYRVRGLEDLPELEIVESGATFADNAILKARAVCAATGQPALADDSGLAVDALGGAPGVHSARYAGEGAADQDKQNRDKLLAALRDVPAGQRGARFVCVLAYVDPQGLVHTSEGLLLGAIALAERGSGGFGYDSIFVPQGGALTAAELSPKEKNRRSHRGQALRDMVAWLSVLGPPR